MNWKKAPVSPDEVRSMSVRYDLDPLLSTILLRRSVNSPEKLLYYLEDDPYFLHNPFLFAEMEEIIDRLQEALQQEEKIIIYGDRDVDGMTSIALLYSYLKKKGQKVDWDLPRGDEVYGLSRELLHQFKEKGYTLLITVDCGISNIDEIALGMELGIDTIVVDHHQAAEYLPSAFAFLNPQIKDSEYPHADLAGCGVVSKLVYALELAESPLYNKVFCLLNIRPANDSYLLEAVKIRNLMVEEKMQEVLVPGMAKASESRVVEFIQSQEIIVYNAPVKEKMLKNLFGPQVEIHLLDAAVKIWKAFPSLQGMSLLRLREKSKMLRYRQKYDEIDVFINLFLSYLKKEYPQADQALHSCLDLAALGTLADLMPMLDENRIMVKLGLQELPKSHRLGIKYLLHSCQLSNRELYPGDISWQIAPLLNASGRMGQPDLAVRLLLTEDSQEALELIGQLNQLNDERKKISEEIWGLVQEQAFTNKERFAQKFTLVFHEKIQRGITGVLASRLAKSLAVPAIVLAKIDDLYFASIRSAAGFNCQLLLEECQSLFQEFGGHTQAAGFRMPVSNLEVFIEKLEALSQVVELDKSDQDIINIDAELPASYLDPELINKIDKLQPFGKDNPPIVFLSRNLKCESVERIGQDKRHLKLIINTGKYKWPALYWNSAEQWAGLLENAKTLNLIFQVERSFFQGKSNLQMKILDIADLDNESFK